MTLTEASAKPFLSARGISKQFAGVEVLSDVDLDLMPGEIHALVGENGAGKSTFAKIVAGVHRPTRGTLNLNGQLVDIATPMAAQKLGVTLIHCRRKSRPWPPRWFIFGARALGKAHARCARTHGSFGRCD
jgi:ABC-type sugar transport system ATPase subunit